jgi:hypothetical protein
VVVKGIMTEEDAAIACNPRYNIAGVVVSCECPLQCLGCVRRAALSWVPLSLDADHEKARLSLPKLMYLKAETNALKGGVYFNSESASIFQLSLIA